MLKGYSPQRDLGRSVGFADAIDRALADLIEERKAVVGICGLGYVGLPLVVAAAHAGYPAIGFDIDEAKISRLNAGASHIAAVSDDELRELCGSGQLHSTSDFSELASCDVICICVPTPLTRHREPDVSFIECTARSIAKYLRVGQLVALESTTYPGTTDGLVKPILEAAGLTSGVDFFLGYSPEREDPGSTYRTVDIPKVVAGDGPKAKELMTAFYSAVFRQVIPVSGNSVAEVVKITENVFRFVNISLVNELKVTYAAMGIDIWEVIEAAKTKPFGFMPFYPGPGLGGHCIPIDPFYLTWKSREFGLSTRFVELAGEVNQSIPDYVLHVLEEALDLRLQLSLSCSSVLVVGVAYKKNVSDTRESPALILIESLAARGADVAFCDPHVPSLPQGTDHVLPAAVRRIELSPFTLALYDAAVIVTDHDDIDYALLERHSRLILDTRNAVQSRGILSAKVVKA